MGVSMMKVAKGVKVVAVTKAVDVEEKIKKDGLKITTSDQ